MSNHNSTAEAAECFADEIFNGEWEVSNMYDPTYGESLKDYVRRVESEEQIGFASEDFRILSDYIFVEDSIQPIDALIVCGSPWIELMDCVADIYEKTHIDTIVLSGKHSNKTGRVMTERLPQCYQGDYFTEAEMMGHILEDMGVPVGVMLFDYLSTDTYENMVNSLAVLSPETNNRIGICCQAFQARRALLTAQSIDPKREYLIFPAITQGISKDSWIESEYGIQRVLGEVARCVEYFGEFPDGLSDMAVELIEDVKL